MAKKINKKSKKVSKVVAKSQKKVVVAKAKKLSTEEVLVKLHKAIKRMVGGTMMRYQNGPMASIFNEQEIEALAQDTALEVARRVQCFNKNARSKEGVNPKGCEAYFCRAFINQCQKMYEKYAKTDTRAGVQTVGSEEAMAVAANKNFVNPENQWILDQEFKYLINKLKEFDLRTNDETKKKAIASGKEATPADLQHNATIIEKSLLGYEANEIREMLNLSEADYNRHRRAALDLAREKCPSSLAELLPHLDIPEDYRLLTREVKKRKKAKSHIPNYSFNKEFFLRTSKESQGFVSSLFVKIEVMDGEDKVKTIPSKILKLDELPGSFTENAQIRHSLWSKSKSPEILSKIDILGEKLINPRSGKK